MRIVLSFGGPKEGALGNEPSSHTLLFPQLVLPQYNFIYNIEGPVDRRLKLLFKSYRGKTSAIL